MTAPGTIWASVGYRSENDIRGEFACHPDLYKGSEQYTRTATIPDPLDDPRVKALVEAMKNVAEQSTRDEIPDGYGPDHVDGFDDGYDAAIMNCRAALSTLTKESPHER